VPSLAELASTARLSPFHFHRLFKRAVGVTPRQYRNGLLVERAKDALRKGQSVTSALYDAGFSSSGRFYESSGRQLGMTPRQYQKGALDVRFSVRRCSLGWLLVAATARGVCEVWLGDDRDRLQRRLSVLFPHSVPVRRDRPFSKWLDLVMRAVDKPENAPGLPLDLRGTAFQMQVWNAIREIPIGTSRTYAQLARKIGNPKTVRAVANACASNPTAIVVPCHRVMRTDGGLGGYRWGLKRKKVLLGREKAIPE
jgi:AraC family transcriptional regulator of adaptative response/methylated-DNA-[protein]-cysteine methyltransferase